MIAAFTNHLWQSTLFVIAAALVAAALRKNGAHVRHRIWLIASLKFLGPFSLLMSLGSALPSLVPAATTSVASNAPDLSIAVDRIAQPFTSDVFTSSAPVATATAINWTAVIGGMWACGFVVIVLMRFRDWRRIRAAMQASVPVPITLPVPVRSSPGLLEPGVVGLFRPVLLVPDGIEHQLTSKQLEAVLAHELCHVKRRDNLTSAMHMIVEAVFWFHPLVWFVGARLVDERERACDEHVLRVCGEPMVYAESILNVCKLYVESPIACVSGVGGANLRKRVAAILVNRVGLQLNLGRKVSLAIAAVLAVALPLVAGMVIAPLGARADAQSVKAGQKFDVASIKPCAPDSGPAPGMRGVGAGAASPGYLHLNCLTLRQLLNMASGNADNTLNALLRNRKEGGFDPVRGGPAWVASDRFTIEAKAEGVTDRKTLTGAPLLALLVDRFQLTFHRATEDRAVYAMTVAPGGLKPQPVAPSACFELDPSNLPPPGTLNGRQLCGTQTSVVPFRALGARIGKDPFAAGTALSDFLSFMMDRVVVDKTGLDARYDIEFAYMPNEATPGAVERIQRGREGGPPLAMPTGGPTIFKALEDLGLKLTPAKEPVDYLVIDRVERLRPNSPAESAIHVPVATTRSRSPR